MIPHDDEITLTVIPGTHARPVLEEIARLRIEVFREYPYLYGGSMAYEQAYLKSYTASIKSRIAIVRAGREVVGVSTALPLVEAEPAFQEPFRAGTPALGEVYYFGESVLLPSYRGMGIGSAFMRVREEAARTLGFAYAAFCAIETSEDDPLRPPNYRTPESLWRRHGFSPAPRHTAELSWVRVGEHAETKQRLVFWLKPVGSRESA